MKSDIEEKARYYAGLPYTTTVEYVAEQDGYYVAKVLELDTLIMTGNTPAEAVAELESVKEEWFETQLELGNSIPPPIKSRKFSGQYRLRMEPSLHQKLTLLAEHEGVSLNQYIVTKLAMVAGGEVIDLKQPIYNSKRKSTPKK